MVLLRAVPDPIGLAHPRLVGQARTSRECRSRCAHESAAQRSGVTCVHGIAFGSPARPLTQRGRQIAACWPALAWSNLRACRLQLQVHISYNTYI